MRALVLGGTGAMGSHVCAALALRGWEVVATTRRHYSSTAEGLTYAVGDAHDSLFLEGLLSKRWDAIVDFMVWGTPEFQHRYPCFLSSTDQYVFTSSYRVYADSAIIREDSPRLIDAVDDPRYLATDEYALSKARCENMLFGSGVANWTIIRPAVTYDGAVGRLQLGVLESGDWLWRASRGIPVPLPGEMLVKQATMSYGGDVAEMISRLIGNPAALSEAFTVSGSDHMPWGDVAATYQSVLPSLDVVPCGLEPFERMWQSPYQVRYDRMYNRVIDNAKVLAVTGMSESDLMGMRRGLARELGLFLSSDKSISFSSGMQANLDRLVGGFPSIESILHDGGIVSEAKYLGHRLICH